MTHAFVDVSPAMPGSVCQSRGRLSRAPPRCPVRLRSVSLSGTRAEPEDWRDLLQLEPDDSTAAGRRDACRLRGAQAALRNAWRDSRGSWPASLRSASSSRGTARSGSDIEARIRTLGIERNVVLTGFHPHPEQLIALADVCLLASAREGLPRVLMQYLAGGRPVVAADLPCIDDVLRHGVNGLVVGSDLDGLADAVVALLDDPARRARLARGAAATDLSEWDAARMGERLEAVYADVIRERMPRRMPRRREALTS